MVIPNTPPPLVELQPKVKDFRHRFMSKWSYWPLERAVKICITAGLKHKPLVKVQTTITATSVTPPIRNTAPAVMVTFTPVRNTALAVISK